MRHQGGNKIIYRHVDFLREKKGVPGKVETIEYDPYRTAFIVKVIYADGDRANLIAPRQVGSRSENHHFA